MAHIAKASGVSLTSVANFLSGLTWNDKVAEAIKLRYPKVSPTYLFGSGDES